MAQQRLRLYQSDRQDRRGLMAALDATQCLIWFSAEGQVVEANANMQSLLGWPHEVLRRKTYQTLLGDSGGHDTYFREHWGRILNAHTRSEERALATPGGETLWCALTYAPIRDSEGKARRVLGIVIDLSPWNRNPKEGLARIY